MITDIMLDIETTGRKPGCKIIQIAALPFNANTNAVYLEESFCKSISYNKQKVYGLHDDPDTINWWKKTNKDLFKKLALSNNGPKFVANSLKNWFLNLPENKKIRVWGNSPRFDCSILQGFIEKTLKEQPFWNTFNERDVRTIAAIDPVIKKNMVFKGTQHDAIDDCNHQVRYLKAILYKYNIYIK